MRHPDRFDCLETFRRLDDFLDRELSAEETRLVEAHLAGCVECTEHVNFEGSVLRELRSRLQRIDAPAGLVARLRRALASVDSQTE